MATIKVKDCVGALQYLYVEGNGTEASPFYSVTAQAALEKNPLFQLMDTIGDGSGSENMNVNGSVTPVTFLIKPSAGQVIKVARMITSLRDTGTMDSGGWGSNGGNPLTNGLELKWKRNGVTYNLTKSPIKSHYDLASISYDISHNNWGTGDAFVISRFTFTKSGQYLTLDGDLGDELQVTVNDNLTFLVNQRISVQGYYA